MINTEDKITAVYACDRNLYHYLPMTINSFLVNNPNGFVYAIIEDDELDTIKNERVKIINIDNIPSFIEETSPNINTRWGKFALIRCYLSKILEENKIIWLDVDTLVLQNLQKLWETFDENYIIGGVQEFNKPIRDLPENFVGNKYINTGSIIMNLKKIREEKIDNDFIRLLNTQKYIFPDQDVINLVCHNRIQFLDGAYNFSKCTINSTITPHIIHFAGPKKPWDDITTRLCMYYYIDKLK